MCSLSQEEELELPLEVEIGADSTGKEDSSSGDEAAADDKPGAGAAEEDDTDAGHEEL